MKYLLCVPHGKYFLPKGKMQKKKKKYITLSTLSIRVHDMMRVPTTEQKCPDYSLVNSVMNIPNLVSSQRLKDLRNFLLCMSHSRLFFHSNHESLMTFLKEKYRGRDKGREE